jgi:glycosyltransferase involved in cell wall biosynthesis
MSEAEAQWPYQPPDGPALPATLPDGRPWPRISIVTPSLNQGRFIEETILSVLHQDYPSVEYIVMDGGSTDETAAILARYQGRLAFAASEKDKGQSEAINKGFARATGEIMTWLNADDILAPGALAAVALAFATSGADMVAGICVIHDEGRILHRHLTAASDGSLPLAELLDLEGGWLEGEFFYQPEVFFSRSLWERAGAKVEENLYYSMDYELWLRFAEAGGVLHGIGRPLALFRVHPGQKTHAPARFQAELRQVRDAYYARRRLKPPALGAGPRANRPLRIAMINDVGELYGAGIAHGRIAAGLRLAGHEVRLANLRALQGDEREDGIPVETRLLDWIRRGDPDLVIMGNLHAAGGDTPLLAAIAKARPTFWVLHDFWLLTGRCAFTGGCPKYLPGCDAACPTPTEYPALAPELIAPAWAAKRALLAGESAPVLLANSASAADFARSAFASPAARPPIEDIRLGIPLDIYRPQSREACRKRFGLPLDRTILLFSAAAPTDRRKGGAHLFEALASLKDLEIICCVLGNWDPSIPLPDVDMRSLGYLRDPEDLACAFGAADVFVAPSLEESFGQVFVEAAACGTPAVGYPVMGVKNALRDGVTGRLAAAVTPAALADSIRELATRPELRAAMGAWGRLYVENEFSIEAGYRQLFLALQRLGILSRAEVPRRINFAPPQKRRQFLLPAAWERGEGIGELEGPHLDDGIPTRFHWCIGPDSWARVTVESAGPHLIVIEYQNPFLSGQQVTVFLDDRDLGIFSLVRTSKESARLLCLRVPLTPGSHVLRLRFAHALPPSATEPRRLALMLNDIHLEPLPATDTRKEPLEQDRVS